MVQRSGARQAAPPAATQAHLQHSIKSRPDWCGAWLPQVTQEAVGRERKGRPGLDQRGVECGSWAASSVVQLDGI